MSKKTTTEVTNVLFVWEENPKSILAVFPDQKEGRAMVMGYSHVGQHSRVGIAYYKKLEPAMRSEYMALYNELIAQGYILHVQNDGHADPIKRAITSERDGRTIIIYQDGGIKIFDQGQDYDTRAIVINIEPHEMQDIIAAIQAPQ
jgi:hypothetical protein